MLAEIEDADSTRGLGLAQEEVSLALSVPPRTAQARLKAARSLVRELPSTIRLLAAGKITSRHAQLITETSWRLPRPAIHITVSADTLLGLDDQPAHLTGYGAITAETARRLAADRSGTWRSLTDPDTGQLLDISERHYRLPQWLRDFVNARDDTCAFPTCSQPVTAANTTTSSRSAEVAGPAGAMARWRAIRDEVGVS